MASNSVNSGIELLVMISEGFKVSDFGGGPDHNHQSLQFHVLETGNFLHANVPMAGVLCKLHMVSLGSVPTMCFAPLPPKKKPSQKHKSYSLGVLAQREVT